ncbi:MAG: type II toxin-antitoxin system Phd/YefM family antitoxin [Patescibacteria group bacterium]
MLEVDIEKILPVTEVRDSLNKIVDEVSANDILYVLTVNGKPSAVVVGVHHLEKLTGIANDSIATVAPQTPITGGTNSVVTPTPVQQTDDAAASSGLPEPTTPSPVQPSIDPTTPPAPAPLPEIAPEQVVVPSEQQAQPAPAANDDASDDLSFTINPSIPPTNTPDNQFKTPAGNDLGAQQASNQNQVTTDTTV